MAQMQVMGWAQGWSLANKVTLIIANHRTSSMSGSGVWRDGAPLGYYYYPGNAAGDVHVVDVTSSEPALVPAKPSQPFVVNSTELVRTHASRNVTSQFPPKSEWEFAALSTGKVCSGSVCCTASGINGGANGYAIAAINGMDNGAGTSWAASGCAVLACASPSSSCLDYQSPRGSLTGVTLSATGLSGVSVFPEVITTSGNYPQLMLTPGDSNNGFTFTSGASASLQIATQYTVTSALLYGRKFSDDSLPYKC